MRCSVRALGNVNTLNFAKDATAELRDSREEAISVSVTWSKTHQSFESTGKWPAQGSATLTHSMQKNGHRVDVDPADKVSFNSKLVAIRIFSLDASAISKPVGLQPNVELKEDGANLAAVLTQLQDHHPERFDALNEEFMRWVPEFDRILLDTPSANVRAFMLRTRQGKHRIRAEDASQGTLLALAMLTLAHLPKPAPLICFEEPDRGLHPRLIRDVRDALYRLAYPDGAGEVRPPVQVIATTHSPYLVDEFKDRPEEIVIAHKETDEVRFERLTDQPHIDEILDGVALGDAWYTGILGGVPSR